MKTSLFKKLGAVLLLAPLAMAAQPSFPAGPAAAPSDANIAAIVVAANSIDIKAGKLAEKNSDNADVKSFGAMMVRDHEAVNQQATDLVTKLKVIPQPNDLSRKLETDADATYARLKAMKGAGFDRAYVDNEVAYHQAVISVVESMLTPAAQNAELKALLQQVLPALQAHLEHAKHLQAKLK